MSASYAQKRGMLRLSGGFTWADSAFWATVRFHGSVSKSGVESRAERRGRRARQGDGRRARFRGTMLREVQDLACNVAGLGIR